MKQSKFDRILADQTAVCRKVFMAIPAACALNTQEINLQLQTLGISVPRNFRLIEGCVNSLARAGLAIESPRGYFRRAVTTPDSVSVVPDEEDLADTPDIEALLETPDDVPAPKDLSNFGVQPDPAPAPAPAQPKATAMTQPTKPEANRTAAALSRLTALEADLGKIQQNLQDLAAQVQSLRTDALAVAKAVVDDIDANAEAAAKLKQLQVIFKDL